MGILRNHRTGASGVRRAAGIRRGAWHPPVEPLTERANDGLFALVLGLGMVVAFVWLTAWLPGGVP